MKTPKTIQTHSGQPKPGQVFDTIAQAAAVVGIAKGTLQKAKKLGCPAFTNGRVHSDVLMPWLAANKAELMGDGTPSSLDEAKLAVLIEDLRRKKIANDEAEGLLVRREDLIADARPSLERIREMIYQKLAGEMPKGVSGFDLPQCRVYGTRMASEIVQKLADVFAQWKV